MLYTSVAQRGYRTSWVFEPPWVLGDFWAHDTCYSNGHDVQMKYGEHTHGSMNHSILDVANKSLQSRWVLSAILQM